MKLIADRKSLLHLLQTVSPAVASGTTQPVLAGILLESNQQGMAASAYDLEIGIKEYSAPSSDGGLEVIQDGSVVVPAKQVIDLLRKLSDGQISLEVDSNDAIVIRSGKFECSVPGMPGGTFPRLPSVSHAPAESGSSTHRAWRNHADQGSVGGVRHTDRRSAYVEE